MPEREIEKVLVREVRNVGGIAYKWVSPGNAGVPDRIVIFPGKDPVFVEVKTEKGKLTRLQESQIRRLERLGQTVYVARGIGGVRRLFEVMGYGQVSQSLERGYGPETPGTGERR